jgi:hypothetical protein
MPFGEGGGEGRSKIIRKKKKGTGKTFEVM